MFAIRNFVLIVLFAATSCGVQRSGEAVVSNESERIRDFIAKIKMLPLKYRYDLESQDGENTHKTNKSDSPYFSEFISVIGILPDTSTYYGILYLEPGDDLYPALKVFSKSGKLLDAQSVSYGDCASGDCEIDSCASSIQLIDKWSIESTLQSVNTKCDSLGNKINETLYRVKKKQIISVGRKGLIEFGTEEESKN